MREEYIEEIKNICNGYCGLNENLLIILINNATSLNELLHALHSYIINNEEIIQKEPILKQKKYTNGYPIFLRGDNNDNATSIYNHLPSESQNGYTDIIASNNQIIIMVRDRGHALVIEIDCQDEKSYVKYFIPKICNVAMINNLQGIRKINHNSSTASGEFETPTISLGSRIANFIEMVPTDWDMEFLTNNQK